MLRFNGPFVVNLSNGDPEGTAGQFWKNLLGSNGVNKWILFVAAVGNDDFPLASKNEFPAALARDNPNLISVGALDESGSFIWESSPGKQGSNYGSLVEILAPGENVPCAMDVSDKTATYAKVSGTSVAAPMVTAVAALLFDKSLVPGEVKARILATAIPLKRQKDTQPLSVFGRLSAERALLNPRTLHLSYENGDGKEVQLEGSLLVGDSEIKY